MISSKKVEEYLNLAQDYANENSGCCKVSVGSLLIIKKPDVHVYGANQCLPDTCKSGICHRIELYGEDSKNHRLPSDCRSIHSEIDAICSAARFGLSTLRAYLIVTRYPCEACARAIVKSGISEVYYGREQEISEETVKIFESGGVKVHHVKNWTYEDTTR